jgi:hypothetical protein
MEMKYLEVKSNTGEINKWLDTSLAKLRWVTWGLLDEDT